MPRLAKLVLALGLAGAAAGAGADELVRRFGKLVVAVDLAQARPGGIAVVKFRSRWLGSTSAVFEGRRAPVFRHAAGSRALVPISAGTPPGDGLLGIELATRSGLQRLRLQFPIAAREFGDRTQTLSEDARALLRRPDRLRDGRRLMLALRTFTKEPLWGGPLRPPVAAAAVDSFGRRETYVGGSPVEMMMDGGFGEQHRGLDYPLAAGEPVRSPAGGSVVMAESLLLTGLTLVLDHGQGLVSLLCHLDRLDVRVGDRVEPGAPVGLSGATGLAPFPHLHWATYLHGIAVDPEAAQSVLP